MEAPTDCDPLGGMVHLSGPLSVVYAELKERMMCGIKSDELLIASERKLENLLQELGVLDQIASNYVMNWIKAFRYDETEPVCCHDVIVALQDHIEELQCIQPPAS